MIFATARTAVSSSRTNEFGGRCEKGRHPAARRYQRNASRLRRANPIGLTFCPIIFFGSGLFGGDFLGGVSCFASQALPLSFWPLFFALFLFPLSWSGRFNGIRPSAHRLAGSFKIRLPLPRATAHRFIVDPSPPSLPHDLRRHASSRIPAWRLRS